MMTFKCIINEVEHIERGDAWQEKELLCKHITSIIACDIICDHPLLVKQEPFEITLVFAWKLLVRHYAEYKEGVKKLAGLLKPGGFLLMFIVEHETFNDQREDN